MATVTREQASLIGGMGLLGGAAGLMVAWSATSVVTTVLPLLFGLSGAIVTFILSKIDVNAERNRSKIFLIGTSMASICFGFLASIVIGVISKEHFARNDIAEISDFSNTELAIKKIVLRKQLTSLGASSNEIRLILQSDISKIDTTELQKTFGSLIRKADSSKSPIANQPPITRMENM